MVTLKGVEVGSSALHASALPITLRVFQSYKLCADEPNTNESRSNVKHGFTLVNVTVSLASED